MVRSSTAKDQDTYITETPSDRGGATASSGGTEPGESKDAPHVKTAGIGTRRMLNLLRVSIGAGPSDTRATRADHPGAKLEELRQGEAAARRQRKANGAKDAKCLDIEGGVCCSRETPRPIARRPFAGTAPLVTDGAVHASASLQQGARRSVADTASCGGRHDMTPPSSRARRRLGRGPAAYETSMLLRSQLARLRQGQVPPGAVTEPCSATWAQEWGNIHPDGRASKGRGCRRVRGRWSGEVETGEMVKTGRVLHVDGVGPLPQRSGAFHAGPAA